MSLRSTQNRRSTIFNVLQVYGEHKRGDFKSQTVVMSDNLPHDDDDIEANLPTLPTIMSTPRSSKMRVQAQDSNSSSCDGNEVRRDSSSSNDSQSCKKLASLNEIEDLYSALQDLVKTNVTNKMPATQSVKNNGEPPTHNQESVGRKVQSFDNRGVAGLFEGPKDENLNSNASRQRTSSALAQSADTCNKKAIDKKSGFRRAASTSNGFGNFKPPTTSHMRRVSAQTVSKLSTIEGAQDTGAQNGTRKVERSVSVGGNNLPQPDSLVSDNNRENKKWKHKLLSRIRSKTSTPKNKETNEENNENKNKVDLRSYSVSSEMSRKLNTWRMNSNNNNNNISKSLDLDRSSVKTDNIDQIVEALQLEVATPRTKTKTKTEKCAESELSKLESWFEKAAAQATAAHNSRQSSDYDNEDSDTRTPPGSKDLRRRTINRNKKVGLKRNKSIHDPVKRERRMRQVLPTEDYVSNNINSFIRLSHAKSTPDLRDLACDSDDFGDSRDYCRDSNDYSRDYCRDYSRDSSDISLDSDVVLDGGVIDAERSDSSTPRDIPKHYSYTESTAFSKSLSPKTQKSNRKISLDENIRLPKTPLFYTPSTDNLQMVSENEVFDDKTQLSSDEKTRSCERPLSMPAGLSYTTTDNEYKEDNTMQDSNPLRRKSISSPNVLPNSNSNISNESTNRNTSFISETRKQSNDNSSVFGKSTFGDLPTDSFFHNNMLWGSFWNDTEATANTASKLIA